MNKKKNATKKNNINLYLLPLIFMACIIPFIVFYKEYDTKLSNFNWFSSDPYSYDFFLYYKQICLIFITLILLSLILYKLCKDKHSLPLIPILIPITGYILLVIISSLLSKNINFAFTGIYEQFEGLFVHIGYFLVIIYSLIFIKDENDVKLFTKYFILSIAIMSVIGITQALGFDFFNTTVGKKMILPNSHWDNLNNISFNFKDIYLTLYNPNYVGVYLSLIIPFIFGLCITSKNKNNKIYYFIILIVLCAFLIPSGSEAAIVSLVVTIPVIMILFRKYLIKYIKFIIPVIIVFIIACLIIFNMTDINIKTVFQSLIPNQSQNNLTDINTEEDIVITYKSNDLIIGYSIENDYMDLYFNDIEGNAVETIYYEQLNTFEVLDKRFNGITVSPVMSNDLLSLKVTIDKHDWIFTKSNDNTFYYINKFGKLDKIKEAESAIFTDYENFASGRGYIWSRSIPLLKDSIIIGSGVENYTIVFPQQDYVNLYNNGFADQVLTKPHSLYLQIGVQSGFISLMLFLIFYLIYFIWSFKIYYSSKFISVYEQTGVSIFIGTISYMIISMANDSTITVAPIFWVLISLGITINYKLSRQNIVNK